MTDAVTIQIPAALRPQVDNQPTLAAPGGTVGEVLHTLKVRYPEFGQRLYKTEDELNRFINVYLNDEDIRFLDNLQTPVKAGDELAIIPAIAGG
jgi:molybdopterin converting factor small subunit